jgi:hypothetical protein
LKEGFKNHTAFSKEPQADNVAKLLTKLDESTPTSINWQPKELSSSAKQNQ